MQEGRSLRIPRGEWMSSIAVQLQGLLCPGHCAVQPVCRVYVLTLGVFSLTKGQSLLFQQVHCLLAKLLACTTQVPLLPSCCQRCALDCCCRLTQTCLAQASQSTSEASPNILLAAVSIHVPVLELVLLSPFMCLS